jgi:hypothetical protein
MISESIGANVPWSSYGREEVGRGREGSQERYKRRERTGSRAK